MARCRAWLLPLADDIVVAVGELEVAHILQSPATRQVAGAPDYCRHVTLWQNQVLPVFDLAAWLRGIEARQDMALVAVAAYQLQIGARPLYGGLRLADLPRLISVDDAQVCALPTTFAGWPSVALSCFEHDAKATPIVDLPALFSGALLHSVLQDLAK